MCVGCTWSFRGTQPAIREVGGGGWVQGSPNSYHRRRGSSFEVGLHAAAACGLADLKDDDLRECARKGVWPSAYFNALQTALVASGDCGDVINDLPEYAACAAHYAVRACDA